MISVNSIILPDAVQLRCTVDNDCPLFASCAVDSLPAPERVAIAPPKNSGRKVINQLESVCMRTLVRGLRSQGYKLVNLTSTKMSGVSKIVRDSSRKTVDRHVVVFHFSKTAERSVHLESISDTDRKALEHLLGVIWRFVNVFENPDHDGHFGGKQGNIQILCTVPNPTMKEPYFVPRVSSGNLDMMVTEYGVSRKVLEKYEARSVPDSQHQVLSEAGNDHVYDLMNDLLGVG